ncbi:MAG TPA: nucleotidyltransferase family protein [Actinomycetes bacterium]
MATRELALPPPAAQVRRFEALLRSSPWMMAVLRAVRDCDPPDWWVGGGVLRDLVWDLLHRGTFGPALVKDVDVAFYDPSDLRPERDDEVERALAARLPGVRWDAKNQAAVHTWYRRRFGVAVEPLASAADGVATWPETATAVAVRLQRRPGGGATGAGPDGHPPGVATGAEPDRRRVPTPAGPDGRLLVTAAHGLDDLLGMVWRRNPRRVTVAEYRRRLAAKRVTERWPKVTVVDG